MNMTTIANLVEAMLLIDDVLLSDDMGDDEWNELYDAVKSFKEYCCDNDIYIS